MNWFKGQPFMSFETKYKICLWKTYFETGYAITNYAKYPLLLLGVINKVSVSTALYFSVLYAVLCFGVGYLWYKTDFAEAGNEVANRNNKFVKEIRNGSIQELGKNWVYTNPSHGKK